MALSGSSIAKRIQNWPSRARALVLPHLPRAVWRLLPSTSASFGPPRRWQSWSRYRQTHAAGWVSAIPANEGNFPRPFWPTDGTTPFKRGTHYRWPEQGLARITDARVITSDGWCVAPGDVFLGDFSFGGNDRASRAYHLVRQNKPQLLPGVTLNLCSAHAGVNFCHWLLDAVGCFGLFERFGYSVNDVDRILLPRFPGPTSE